MHANQEPWIVTDARLPCLVVEGHLTPMADVDQARLSLEKALTKVSNVYNCAAYRLDESCEALFCIRRSSKAALVYIGMQARIDDQVCLEDIRNKIRASKRQIEGILSGVGSVKLTFETIRVEITGRTPN